MKKSTPTSLLFRLLGFGLSAVVSYALVVLIWGTVAPRKLWSNLQPKALPSGQTAKRLQDAAEFGDVDMLAIGSSLIYRGVDTRAFAKQGIRLFNLGTSAQTPKQTELLLEDYLDALSPEKVLLEVSPAAFSTDGVESSLDLLYSSEVNLPLTKLAFSHGDIRAVNAAMYRILAGSAGLFTVDTSNFHPTIDRYVEGGYVEYAGSERYTPTTIKPFAIELREDQLAALGRIVQVLRKRNIEVVLLRMPVPEATYNAELGQAAYKAKMASFGRFEDVNKHIQLVDSLHFCDATHLNQAGVELVSPYLLSL